MGLFEGGHDGGDFGGGEGFGEVGKFEVEGEVFGFGGFGLIDRSRSDGEDEVLVGEVFGDLIVDFFVGRIRCDGEGEVAMDGWELAKIEGLFGEAGLVEDWLEAELEGGGAGGKFEFVGDGVFDFTKDTDLSIARKDESGTFWFVEGFVVFFGIDEGLVRNSDTEARHEGF